MMTKRWIITAASGDGAQVMLNGKVKDLLDGDIRDFKHFQILLTAGKLRVFAGLDGTNYATRPLVLSLEPSVDGADVVTENQGRFVAVAEFLAPNRLYHFFGTYKALKFLQKGATGAVGTLWASEE